MKKLFFFILIHSCAALFAGEGKNRQEVLVAKEIILAARTGGASISRPRVRVHHGITAAARGPGRQLMQSFFDYGSNGGVLSNLHDYGDGTLAVGRMAAALPTLIDRATFFSYFNGAGWSPMARVEQERRGWSSIGALRNGCSVTVSHGGIEINIDSTKGAGIWRSNFSEGAGLGTVAWPRFAVDDHDNVIICSTTIATINGVAFIKQVNFWHQQSRAWRHVFLWPDTSTRKPAFSADDQAIAVFGNQIAVAVCEIGGDTHLWTSADDAASWRYQNITNYPATISPGTESVRGAGVIDALYDHEGNLHLFWENYLARPASDGINIDLFESTDDPILHWSAASGIAAAVRFSAIPGTEQDSLVFAAGSSFEQINAAGGLLKQPQAGVDAEGNLYLLFAAFRPNDVDLEGAHFTDVYAVASNDGGKNWGAAINLTDTPQSEDLWASLAENVGDSLRFVYQSDGNTGNGFIGGGAAPTAILYHAFPRAKIPLASAVTHDQASGAIKDFVLAQNFPNPFNPSTAISFSLPASARVRLEVYDMAGRMRATLLDARLEAGNHTVTWNAQDAPSGIYLCRLTGAHFVRSRKMLLLR